MEQADETADQAMDQIDVLVSWLQELDVTDDGREALTSVEASVCATV